MTEEQLQLLRMKICGLSNASYNQGCADESEQQSYKQQDKWAAKVREASDDLYDYIVKCQLSTVT